MSSLLDTIGGYQLPIGLPGAPATGTLAELDTFINEAVSGGLDSAGELDFGMVVAAGATVGGCTILGGASLTPIGITSRRPKQAADVSTKITGYKTGDELGVYRLGDVICMAAEAVTANDQVVALTTAYAPATGIKTNVGGGSAGVANGSTRIAVPYHVWKTTTAQGALGIVSVYARCIAPTLTS